MSAKPLTSVHVSLIERNADKMSAFLYAAADSAFCTTFS